MSQDAQFLRPAQDLFAVLAGGDPLAVARKVVQLLAELAPASAVRIAWRVTGTPTFQLMGWSHLTGPCQDLPRHSLSSSLSDPEGGHRWTLVDQTSECEVWWDWSGDSPVPAAVREVLPLCAAAIQTACSLSRQAERRRLSALAEFAAGAGHEINNPLGSIIGRASQLRRQETDPEKQRALETIGAQAYRIRDMIGDSMLFARPPEPQDEKVQWPQLLSQAQAQLSDLAGERQVTIHILCQPHLSSQADPVQMAVVLAELLRNAIQASPPGNRVELSAAESGPSQIPGVQIQVSDDGTGFSPAQRDHAFDPFYSGRQAGRGLGFGLPKCWRIVQRHGGNLSLQSDLQGTRFQLWLPVDGPGEYAGKNDESV